MKKRFLGVILSVCLVFSLVVVPSSAGIAGNNDEKYDGYKNMLQQNDTGHAKYIVPNLYRQDASYTNVKLFPLVVNDSTVYFPLDIFAWYSYLEVVYSRIAYGFYINNTKNNHYVAFDMETGTTTTHDSQLTDVKAQIFNRTYYVPAQVVCETLGMNFEFYDSPEDGIIAARISDSKAKMTLNELVVAYSPTKKEEEKPSEPTPDTPTVPDTPEIIKPTTPEVPTEDPFSSVAERRIYLAFEGCPDSSAANVLDELKSHGVHAVFFLEKDKILENPDTVRRMITDGHTVGISFSPQASEAELYPNEQIEAIINEANEALCLVTKSKTRQILPKNGYADKLADADFKEYAEKSGFAIYEANIDVSYASGSSKTAFEKLRSDIIGRNQSRARTVYVRFPSNKLSDEVLVRLLDFCESYLQFKVGA